jgi:adhesin transport system outer membrane protein
MHFSLRAICAAIVLLGGAGGAVAQSADTLRAAAEKAITTNPEVTARFNALRAAGDAIDVARGGFLPRVDLNASVGRDEANITSRSPETQSVTRSGVGVSVTQLLWDGLGTRDDVRRLSHDRLSRYFELLDTTEQTALEAVRAQIDVQRYRRLVKLAEDNYVQHRYALQQIRSRVTAGVGRGVDLEQAGARVALAESNLTTELANLHDVTARYQRIVGEAPPASLPAPVQLRQGVPASAADAMSLALRQSPSISASIEALRSARSSADSRRSLFQPRVEARVRGQAGRNLDGTQDQSRTNTAEIVLNWNLFNGGSDQARVRQQANLVTQAADLRDRACRDVRQVAAIAFNDTRKLADQLVFLDRNTLAIEKARDAYRQQFDIGQRSLLDLLNSENEVYTARRAYANAEFDLALAWARTQAAMNQLTPTLGLSRVDQAAAEVAADWAQGEDAPSRCPVIVADIVPTDRAELDARAARMIESAPAVPAAPAPTPRKP